MNELNRMRRIAGLDVDYLSEENEKPTKMSAEELAIVALIYPQSENSEDCVSIVKRDDIIQAIRDIPEDFVADAKLFIANDSVQYDYANTCAEKFKSANTKTDDAKADAVDELKEAAPNASDLITTTCKKCRSKQEDSSSFQSSWKMSMQARSAGRGDNAESLRGLASFYASKFKEELASGKLTCDDCKNGIKTDDKKQLKEFVDSGKFGNVLPQPESSGKSPEKSPKISDTKPQTEVTEKKRKLPANIKRQLADEIRRCEELGDNNKTISHQDAKFYQTLGAALKNILGYLEEETLQGIINAQVFLGTLMGPMLHRIPEDVVIHIARGATAHPLKSYMNPVDLNKLK